MYGRMYWVLSKKLIWQSLDDVKHEFYIPYIPNSDSISNNPINRPKKRGGKKKEFEKGLAIQKEHENVY